MKQVILVVTILAVVGVVGYVATRSESPFGDTDMPGNMGVSESTNLPETSEPGSYEPYEQEKLNAVTDELVVLFFHASWCPTCRGLDADISENKERIPENVVILKTDFDTEHALRERYGVTYQHTLVQVDSNGNQIRKWSGSQTLTDIVSRLES